MKGSNGLFRKGWFKDSLLVLLLLILAVGAFKALFPGLLHHGGHSGESRHEGHNDGHGQAWWQRAAAKGPWKGMLDCPADQLWIQTRLYMGRDADRSRLGVSEEDWQDFLDAEIRTRLPDGFSVSDVYGFSAEDNPNHEKWTKVLILLHDGSKEKRAALDEIANAYLERFSENATLRSDSVACIEFRTRR